MMIICFVVLSLAIAQSAYGLTPSGKCPEVKLLPDFNWPAYTGVWYEQERYPASYEVGRKCAFDKYSLVDGGDGSMINVTHSGINSTTNEPINVRGYAKIEGPGQWAEVINHSNEKELIVNYIVLGTDNISWAAVYSCNQTRLSEPEHAWILTRDQNASQEVIAKGRQVMVNNGLPLAPLLTSDQKNCPKLD